MKYTPASQARNLPGLRLALTVGVPGPWSQAAMFVFDYKQIPYIPVAQLAGEDNADLVAWTGIRNAPIAVYNDEAPRIGWEEILMLAERISREPSLIPSDPRDRALMFGLSHEIASEDGLAWNRRHQLLAPMLNSPDAETNPKLAGGRVLGSSYGWIEQAAEQADARIRQVLGLLSEDADFAGGSFRLTRDGVDEAFEKSVAGPMGKNVEEAAFDCWRVVNANMTQAVRRTTAGKGMDPKDLTMLAYGGNGPVFAAIQAQELGIPRVLVPKASPTFSALGALSAQPVIDEERS